MCSGGGCYFTEWDILISLVKHAQDKVKSRSKNHGGE